MVRSSNGKKKPTRPEVEETSIQTIPPKLPQKKKKASPSRSSTPNESEQQQQDDYGENSEREDDVKEQDFLAEYQSRKNGRPPELTMDMVEQFRKLIPRCCRMETVCHFLGVSTMSVSRWRRRGQEEINRLMLSPTGTRTRPSEEKYLQFCYMLKQSVAEKQIRVIDGIYEHGKKHWQALAWLAERRWPKQWGKVEKHEITGKDGEGLPAVQVYLPDNGRGKPTIAVEVQDTEVPVKKLRG